MRISLEKLRNKLSEMMHREIKIIRVPTGISFLTYSYKGQKYVKVFDLKNGGNVCFKVDGILYENSELGDSFIEAEMFQPLEDIGFNGD